MVVRDVILIELVKSAASVRQNLTFRDVGDAALLILKLSAINHNGIRLGDISHEGIVRGIHSAFAEGHHAAVGTLAGIGVNGSQHRNAHTGGLLRRIGLRAAHLAHADDVRIETQSDIQQCDLINALALILAVTGLRVDDRVRHPPVTLPDELEFSRAIFNGKDTLAVRDGREEPARHGGLAGGSCSRHADRHAIAQACGQKVQHFLCGCATLHEVRLAEIPGIHDTDGCGNTGILIQHRRFDDRDTNILCQSGGNDGAGIVQYLAGVLQHTADDIGGVFRRIEMLLQLGGMTVRILDLNVPPGVDIDLLNSVREDVLG